MSRATLVDAIAIGQFTPGPVFHRNFYGYQLNGLQGAIVATIAISYLHSCLWPC
jgi:chromate transporter